MNGFQGSGSRALHVAAEDFWPFLVPGIATRGHWCPGHQCAPSACVLCCSSRARPSVNLVSGSPVRHESPFLHSAFIPSLFGACVCLPLFSEWNHSYYTDNSFSAPHSVQQLQNGTIATSVQPLAYTQEAIGAASSGFVSSPLLPRSAISSQVPACPTRNVTGDVMPLSEAITQLSFLEFLQRCGIPIAPPQPSHQPVSSLSFDVAVQTSSHSIHTSSLDAAVQTIPHSTLSQHVSTQMGSRTASSFSVDLFVQTPTRSTVPHDVATQLPLTEFFIGCIFSNDPLDRQNFDRQSPSSVQDDIGSVSPPLTCSAMGASFTSTRGETSPLTPSRTTTWQCAMRPVWWHLMITSLRTCSCQGPGSYIMV